jgi:hypothetical protein
MRWTFFVSTAALIVGAVSAYAASAAQFNAISPWLVLVLYLAVVGWNLRGRDILEVVGPAFLVAYAGYAGIVLVRAPITVLRPTYAQIHGLGAFATSGPLSNLWPVLILGGVIVALILTVAIALPVASIPIRSSRNASEDAALWTFVAERTALGNDASEKASPAPHGKPST